MNTSVNLKTIPSDRALDDAHHLLHSALNAYRREQRNVRDSQASPQTCLEAVRDCLDAAACRGISLSVVVLGHWRTATTDLLGEGAERFLLGDVLTGGHGLTVLQREAHLLDTVDRDRLSGLSAKGATVKVVPGQATGVIVVGSELALVNSTRPGQSGAVRLLRDPDAVQALHQLTAVLHDVAADFDHWVASAALLDKDLMVEVLRMLCLGAKDETSARQMRVSVRSFRRHVAAIIKTLNVRSRFEAGLRIGQLAMASGLRPPGHLLDMPAEPGTD
ncbi:helix-turn-helix transcriptional regulator [Streptomyces sp. DT18]